MPTGLYNCELLLGVGVVVVSCGGSEIFKLRFDYNFRLDDVSLGG
jgi:hypothetical protein